MTVVTIQTKTEAIIAQLYLLAYSGGMEGNDTRAFYQD